MSAITFFKVIQGHRFWYQPKAHIRLPISGFSHGGQGDGPGFVYDTIFALYSANVRTLL